MRGPAVVDRVRLVELLAIPVIVASLGLFAAEAAAAETPLVSLDSNGRLVYAPDARGNRIPDYSYAGYEGGGVALPVAAAKVTLHPDAESKDDTKRIQAAIDQVGKMPADAHGVRGAVLLTKGVYTLNGTLTISTGGVILRGERSGEDSGGGGTLLRVVLHKKGTLIRIEGDGKRKEDAGTRRKIADARVPVGANSFTVESADGLKVGDEIMVVRDTNAKWVHAVGMDEIPGRPSDPTRTQMWKPGPREGYDRTITKIEGNRITLDVPLYNDITAEYGGGYLYRYSFPARIAQCGVENLRAVSIWTKKPGEGPADEKGVKTADELQHVDHFVVIDNAQDCWVRDCACLDFLQGGVWVETSARRCTIQDCYYEVPDPKLNYYVDEPHGQTSRYSFSLHGGENLVFRCLGKFGRHTYMTQSQTPGPNVFLDSDAIEQHNISETHHRWATGVLFDCIGQKNPTSLESVNRAWMGSGHGWSGAYVTLWNCVGNPIICEVPPTASNWAIGCMGERKHGPFNESIVEAAYYSWGKLVQPMSLYRAQLRDRLGEAAVENLDRK